MEIHKGSRIDKRFYISLAVILLLLIGGCQDQFPEKISPIKRFSQLQELFADPPADYRSAPLWDWNHDITKEGIDLHMQSFKDAGMGGVFVHPRPGLITEYLSEEWFELFDYTVEKAKELGMNVWIYDENSYPSGFAGGHVPAAMPESWNMGSGLKLEKRDTLLAGPFLYEVILKKVDEGFMDVTASVKEEYGKAGNYYLFYKTFPPTSYWYGGFTYVDLLKPGVTEKFMEVTMTDGYEKHNSVDFGKTVKGVFTDEPNLEAAMERGTLLRWTPDLWEEFQERWGYDLRLHLPSLLEETGQWKKVRHDYYELLLELFIDRWAMPWYQYCEETGLDWTGHYWEHGWPFPTHGFDEAAFYIWHQQPGIDMLGSEMIESGLGAQFGNTRAVRELASAANQAGHLRTLSETYGGGGWEMDFSTYKRLADWQAVLGVNFVNQHLSYYSLRGVRKFDYPPSFTYHEPWWENYRVLGDYIGRLSLVGSSGEQLNDILLLQPNTSAWMYYSRSVKNFKINHIQDRFKTFTWQLERQHVEYDLGSEQVLKRLGSAQENRLRVGNRDYSLVVIPASMENLDQGTYELLLEYLEGGGKIISFAARIPYLDGSPSEAVNEMLKSAPDRCLFMNDVSDPAFAEITSREEFKLFEPDPGKGELYHQRRILEDGQLLLLVNSSPDQNAIARIDARGKSVIRLDLLSGEMNQEPVTSQGNNVSFEVSLPPSGSSAFFLSNQKSRLPLKKKIPDLGVPVAPSDLLEVRADQDNVLVLNYLDLISKDLDLKDSYFMDALLALFESQGLEMGNPWQHKIQYKQDYLKRDTFPEHSGFEVSYHFTISDEMDLQSMEAIRAVVEGDELWDVYINGVGVLKEEGSFWIDRNFYYFPVGAYLRKGRNTLSLKAPRMSLFAELMPVYLTGPFLVQPEAKGVRITGGELHSLDSWKEQGYPFYSNKVSYSQHFSIDQTEKDYMIRLKEWRGTTSEVFVNGKKAGQIFSLPGELNVGHLLKEGENEISIKVVGSLKNTFGHFFKTWTSLLNGPHDWNVSPEGIPSLDQYSLMDYGLFEPFELLMY